MGFQVGKVRLRTKFLLSLLAISAGLTAATLLIVSYSVQKRIRESIREDLRNSVATYQSFEKQREGALTNVRGTAGKSAECSRADDHRGCRDDPGCFRGRMEVERKRLAGSGEPRGDGSCTADDQHAGLESAKPRNFCAARSIAGESRDWWFDGHHLYEVWIQPIYFGAPSQNTTIGLLALGDEVDEARCKRFQQDCLERSVL